MKTYSNKIYYLIGNKEVIDNKEFSETDIKIVFRKN